MGHNFSLVNYFNPTYQSDIYHHFFPLPGGTVPDAVSPVEDRTSTVEGPELCFKRLTVFYETDLLTPPPENPELFYQRRELVQEIERTIVRMEPYCQEAIRIKTKTILHWENQQDAIPELGLLLYYLDQDEEYSHEKLLTAHFADRMNLNIESFSSLDGTSGTIPFDPGVKIHFILLSFARLLVTKEHFFNVGGALAACRMLKNPSCNISKYLQPEHRAHILATLNEMVKSPQIRSLIGRKITVAPSMEDVVSKELNHPPGLGASSLDAILACLLGLLSDLRQKDEPNCYAIAALIYATEAHPYRFLSRSLQLLEHGVVRINNVAKIPVAPLTEKFTGNGSIISHMNLAVAEMLYHNVAIDLGTGQSTIFELKSDLIRECIDVLLTKSVRWPQVPELLISKIRELLCQRIWLEPHYEKNIEIKGSTLIAGKRTIEKFQGCLRTLSDVARSSIRICSLKGERYQALHTISDLQEVVQEAIHDAFHRLKDSSSECRIARDHLDFLANSYLFRIHISNACSKQIRKTGIAGKHLNQADLLILEQQGGVSENVVRVCYGVSLSRHRVRGCYSPYTFLSKLISEIKLFNAAKLRKFPKLLINTPGNHVWTLTPHCWSLILDDGQEFYPFIQRNIFVPAKRRLSSPIPRSTVERILDRLCLVEEEEIKLREILGREAKLSFAKFLLLCKECAPASNPNKFDNILNEECSKVSLGKADLSKILRRLNLKIETPVFFSILKDLPKVPCQPYRIARKLRCLLIEKNIAIPKPQAIEQAICKACDLPLPIQVGDFNWQEDSGEDHCHVHLVINFKWTNGRLHYFLRYQEEEIIERDRDYFSIDLIYPEALIKG